MSEEIRYPTPEELVAYLKEPGRKKATGQFAYEEGRCCLGHYADMCGVTYDPGQGVFDTPDMADMPYGSRRAALPDDHWLFADVAGGEASVMGRLVQLNDGGYGDDFSAVIEYLEENLVGKVPA